MKKFYAIFALGVVALTLSSCSGTPDRHAALQQGQVINLYDGPAPGSEDWTQTEYVVGPENDRVILNVTEPTMTVYLPEPAIATGSAMIVCPGGGMFSLSTSHEGYMVAEYLNSKGIAAFVLKYRIAPLQNEDGSHFENMQAAGVGIGKIVADASAKFAAENDGAQAGVLDWIMNIPSVGLSLADGLRALEIVRANAGEWGIDKVGIMGFSAGAVVSLNAAVNHEEKNRPDFVASIYGGWSPDFEVPADAAPLFFCSPENDIFRSSDTYLPYMRWKEAGKAAEIHYFADSVHGQGIKTTGKSYDIWPELMLGFMKDCGFVPAE